MIRQRPPTRYAGYWPKQKTPWAWLAGAACLSLALWWGAQTWLGHFTHPHHIMMLEAAHEMQSATQVARAQRIALGLMQPVTLDPNKTGLIGSEYTSNTTSLGDIAAKRTATNPDLAAALTRRIADLELAPGSPVMVLVSGSFIGGNIAAIIAAETAGLRPIIVSSLGASMYGATDPELTWLDIEHELFKKGVIRSRSIVSVIGGGGATGSNLDDEAVLSFRAAAERNSVPLLDHGDLNTLLDDIEQRVNAAAGEAPRLLINSGGSVAALGTCIDGDRIPLIVTRPVSCTDGVGGMIVRKASEGVPVLHVLALRNIAAEWGLPFDPVPLPLIGNNRQIYGMSPS